MTSSLKSKQNELAVAQASLTRLESEAAQANGALNAALEGDVTERIIRAQSRAGSLTAATGERRREVERLVDELEPLLAEAAREETVNRVVARAREADYALRSVERLSAELNTILAEKVEPILDAQYKLHACRNDFIALVRELGSNMGVEPLDDALAQELEARGADLTAALVAWPGTPLTISERAYNGPTVEPYGVVIRQALGVAENQRALLQRIADEAHRAQDSISHTEATHARA
jgi:hypothetical protein